MEKDDAAAELEKQNVDAMAALEARALETRQEMEKITELTLAMQRSAQREARLQQRGGAAGEDAADKLVPTREEEELIASFREQQRMQQLNQQTVPAPAAAGAAETEQDQDDIVFTKRKRAKVTAATAVPMSFVAYASDSDEE